MYFRLRRQEISSKTGKEYLYRCPRIEVIGKMTRMFDDLEKDRKPGRRRKRLKEKAVIEYLKNGASESVYPVAEGRNRCRGMYCRTRENECGR